MNAIKLVKYFVFVCLLASCGEKRAYQDRIDSIHNDTERLVIAVAWPHSKSKIDMFNGVELAAKEVNKSGGVLGRKIELKKFDDFRDINEGLLIAEEIAADKSIFAVIGHLDSYISIPTSTTYDSSGLIMITPGSSAVELTQQQHKSVFRMLSNNEEQGKRLVSYFRNNNYQRVLLYYVDNVYGQDIANAFEIAAIQQKVDIVSRRSFDTSGDNHKQVIESWTEYYDFDSILVAGTMPNGLRAIQAIRNAGIEKPIVASGGVDSTLLLDAELGDQGELVVATFYDQTAFNESQLFYERYTAEFEAEPSASAALGYDALALLIESIEKTGSVDRDTVVEQLHSIEQFPGTTGKLTFSENGEPIDKPMYLRKVVNNRFVSIGAVD
ncbi:ABC transporter substrate-binding protein [Catenovulum sediminis]|uniref:ABC transporter substrate-binding protein n=1 Tax=Catenovulum sediminis TaxID=1740262 RepID=A0ABV1RI82_9ALTE